MKEFIIIALCALGAFAISLIITNLIVRKRPKSLLDYVKPNLKDYKKYKAVMCQSENYPAVIVAFRNWDIAVMNCTLNENDFSVGEPVIYKEDDLSLIRLGKMRTEIKLYDRGGSLLFAFNVNPATSKQICKDFPVDVDFSEDANYFYDFIDKFQKRLEDRTNRIYDN